MVSLGKHTGYAVSDGDRNSEVVAYARLHSAWQHPLAERHACSLNLRLREPGRGCSVPILA